MIVRYGDALGLAMLVLYGLSLAGFSVALRAHAHHAVWLFLGASFAAAVTMCLISWLERRIR